MLLSCHADSLGWTEDLWQEFMQRAFSFKGVVAGKEKMQDAAAASITACRPQNKVDYIIYVLTHWQMGIKIHQLDHGSERDRLVRICWQHCNEPS
jgi:hypothetical protein